MDEQARPHADKTETSQMEEVTLSCGVSHGRLLWGLEVRLACDTLEISSVTRSQHPRTSHPHSLTFSVEPRHNLCPCLAKASSVTRWAGAPGFLRGGGFSSI